MSNNGKSLGKEINCGKEALRFLHRTQNADNPHKHQSIVCVICDRFIIGTETIHYLSKDRIMEHSHMISVKSYERYYGKLNDEAKHQYMISDGHLRDLLLSPPSRKTCKGYSTCSCCFSGMQPHMIKKRDHPKFYMANGFIIGSLPTEIH
jgi:hypothetical protein